MCCLSNKDISESKSVNFSRSWNMVIVCAFLTVWTNHYLSYHNKRILLWTTGGLGYCGWRDSYALWIFHSFDLCPWHFPMLDLWDRVLTQAITLHIVLALNLPILNYQMTEVIELLHNWTPELYLGCLPMFQSVGIIYQSTQWRWPIFFSLFLLL